MTHIALAALLLMGLVATGGCSKSSTAPSTTTTTTATATASTEFYTGVLSPKGSSFYSFTVTTAGAVSVTLASTTTAKVGPAVAARLSVGLGIPAGFGCAASSSVNTTPGLTAQLSSASSATGIYCVNVSDPGGLSGDVNFVIRIIHT